MKKICLLVFLLSAAVLCEGACRGSSCPGTKKRPGRVIIAPNGKKITMGGVKFGYGNLTGRMRSLSEEIEDLELKLGKADPETKKGISLRHEREELALEFIHEAQIYMMSGKVRDDTRTRIVQEMMKNEAAFLEKSLADSRKFPYLKYLADIEGMFRDIRQGRVKYQGRIPNRNTALLRDIQDLQRDAMEEIHKKEMRSRRR